VTFNETCVSLGGQWWLSLYMVSFWR